MFPASATVPENGAVGAGLINPTPPHPVEPIASVIGTCAIGVGNGACGTQIAGMVGVSVTVGVCVMVGVIVGVRVAVGDGTQPPVVHASQQLENPVVQLPPTGAVHFSGLFTRHLVLPLAEVRQQVTYPGRPQVDFETHFFTDPAQLRGRSPVPTAVLTTPLAQRT